MIRRLTFISLACMILGILMGSTIDANGTVSMSMAVGVKQDPAGGYTNANLNGKYYFRRLGIDNFETSYRDAQTCDGYIDFNGAGSWAGQASCFDSDGVFLESIPSFNGTYSVNTNGSFTFIFDGDISTGHISSDRNFAILSDGFVDSSGIHQGIVTALKISDTSLLLSDLNGTWKFRELELHDFENVNRTSVICSGTMVCNNGNWNGNVECLDSDGSTNNDIVSGTYLVNGKAFDIYTTGNPEVLFSTYLSKVKNTFIFTRGSSSAGNELFKGIAVKKETKTYTNSDLFGTYFFHDAYIEDFETDNREFSITVGTVTSDGNGNWTGTADSFDSDGSSGSDNISGTYSVNSDGSFTLIVTSETPDVTITGTISDDNNIIVFASGGKIIDEVKPKAMPWIPLLLLDEDLSADFWVDSSRGSNANPGTKYKPFKTITYALSAAGENKTIKVNPGTYNEALGETFPLFLQNGQILIGDEANKGDGTTPTLIVGHGDDGYDDNRTATIIGSEGSQISGFKIGENTTISRHYAILADGINLKVSENTFKTPTHGGVRIQNSGTSVIEKNVFNTSSYGVSFNSSGDNIIQNNSFTSPSLPIAIADSDSYLLIRENTITGSGQVGIQISHGNPLIQNNIFNKITGYTYGAIRADSSGADPTVRENVFNCTKAVVINDGNPDLGSPSENGNNNFSAVTGVSVTHDGSATVYAIGNTWPNTSPVCGEDIVITNSGIVVWGNPGSQCP
jgi:parallel beta-helix repeat protein